MRLPMLSLLLLIAAALLGETQSASAEPPNGYPWEACPVDSGSPSYSI
jgi:hypothetical protein